jgi:hypothetical protein
MYGYSREFLRSVDPGDSNKAVVCPFCKKKIPNTCKIELVSLSHKARNKYTTKITQFSIHTETKHPCNRFWFANESDQTEKEKKSYNDLLESHLLIQKIDKLDGLKK